MQRDVFQTDGDGLFLYKSISNDLALVPGTFNIPYGAYLDAPPSPPTGKWPRRVNDSWVMVEDYRTTPLWVVETGMSYSVGTEHDGASGKVSYPGWGPLPSWLTLVKPERPAQDTDADIDTDVGTEA